MQNNKQSKWWITSHRWCSGLKKIALVINTGGGNTEHRLNDAIALRRATLKNKVPYCTNMSTALAFIEGIKSLKTKKLDIISLQDLK